MRCDERLGYLPEANRHYSARAREARRCHPAYAQRLTPKPAQQKCARHDVPSDTFVSVPAASEAMRLHSVTMSLAPRARNLSDTARSARDKSRRSCTDRLPKPVCGATVKSISTSVGREGTVFIAHLRGDPMSNGNVADFARRVRTFPDSARPISGNRGPVLDQERAFG